MLRWKCCVMKTELDVGILAATATCDQDRVPLLLADVHQVRLEAAMR